VIRVLIVGDIRLYREGLADILSRRPTITVVGSASSREEGVALAAELTADFVLLDMAMPDSLGTVRAFRAAVRAARVVALGVPEVEREVIDCAEAGVAGYVTRDRSLADMVEAVESAARGEALCSPAMTATLMRRVEALAAERSPGRSPLTPRELEIVRLIDDGLSNKQIAHQLCIEIATVKNHVHHILEKLRVQRRSEAAARVRGQSARSKGASI
jgi:two-component system, NarL family, nitrate/nitrite response regulator NarL